MRYKKIITKTTLFLLVLTTFLPGILTPILAGNNYNNNPSVNEAYEKVHNGFLYKKDNLETILGSDSFILNLKEGKTYYFYFKIDNSIGASILVALLGSPGFAEFGSWDADDPENMRKIVFLYTPDSTGNQTLTITKIIPIDNADSDYTVYVNRQGIAGYWWMILIGVGALIIIILVIALIIRAIKPKKGKRKK